MPQAIPLIIQAIGAYLAVNAVVVAVAVLAASALISNYQKRKAKRQAIDAYNASLEDRLVMTATANASRSRVYGRARNVDGIVFKGTWGNDKEFYTLVTAVAGHPIDGVEKIYFNDIPLTLQSDGIPVTGGAAGGVGYYVMTSPFMRQSYQSATATATVATTTGSVVLPETPVAGSVFASITIDGEAYQAVVNVVGNTVNISSAPYPGVYDVAYQWVRSEPKARVWIYNGDPGQTLYPLLSSRFPGLLNPSDKFSGMAIIVVELTYDQDAFPTGVPNVSAVMRGAKILDTRTGITAWSENPAMIARDWALYPYGGGCTASDINEASFIAAANACDVSTVFPLSTGGTETRPLYQCGIVCSTDVKPDDNFGEMVEAMAGLWGFAGGQIKVSAGVYRAPVAAINDTWLSSNQAVGVVKDTPKADLVNHFKPVISNANGWTDGSNATSVSYTATPMPSVRSAAYIAADGQELVRENTMLGVTRSVHAQHICNVLMRDMREGMLVQLPCNMRAWQLELFDIVTLTLPVFGFAAKQFEVRGWKYTVQDGVLLTLKETTPLIYSTVDVLDVVDLSPNTTLPLPWVVPQITGLTVVSGDPSYEDGWPVSRTVVSWDLPTNAAIIQSGRIELQYTTVAAAAAGLEEWNSILSDGTTTSVVINGLRARTSYVFRVRGINTLGVRGLWSVQIAVITADPPPLDTPGLAAGAATEIINGPIDPSTYSGSGGIGFPGQVIVTPSVDCKAIVTCQCDYTVPPGTTTARAFTDFSVDISPSAPGTMEAVFIRNQLAIDQAFSTSIIVTETYTLTAGVAYKFSMFYSDFIVSGSPPTRGSSINNCRTRVELIKR